MENDPNNQDPAKLDAAAQAGITDMMSQFMGGGNPNPDPNNPPPANPNPDPNNPPPANPNPPNPDPNNPPPANPNPDPNNPPPANPNPPNPDPNNPPPAGDPNDPPPASPYSTEPPNPDALRSMFRKPQVDPSNPGATAEIPPDEPIPEPEHMDDKARNAWVESRNREKQFRTVVGQQKQQIEALTAKQEEFQRERDQLTQALKEKDDALKAATEKLGKLDLSGSVEFRKRYDQPLQQAEASLDAAIRQNIQGADTPDMIARHREVILGDDAAFMNHIALLSPTAQADLIERRKTYITLSANRKQALEEWQKTSRGLTDAAARQSAADQLLARKNNAEAAIRFNTMELPAELRPFVTTDEEFAEDVKNANEAFSAFMQTATDEEMARAAHLGHFVPALNRALVMALNEAREFQEAFYVQRGILRPRTRVAPGGGHPTPPAQPPKPKTAEELEAEAERGITGAMSQFMGGGFPQRQ